MVMWSHLCSWEINVQTFNKETIVSHCNATNQLPMKLRPNKPAKFEQFTDIGHHQ